MRGSTVGAFLLLLAAGGVGYAFYQTEEKARLRRTMEEIRDSRNKLPYEGIRHIRIRLHSALRSTRVKEYRKGDRRRVRFLSSDMPGMGPSVRRTPYVGGMPRLFQPGMKKGGRFGDLDLLFQNYDIKAGGVAYVAGREGRVLHIRSKHAGRPAYRFVVDAENRFPLSVEIKDHEGRLVFEDRFETIDFHPKDRPRPKRGPRRPGTRSWVQIRHRSVDEKTLARKAGYPVWIPRWIPAGFRMSDMTIVGVKTQPPPFLAKWKMDLRIAHLTYSDGIAVLSIVEFPADNPVWRLLEGYLPRVGRPQGILTRKITLGFGSALIVDLKETIVVVAGNLPPEELEGCAKTLSRQ